MYFVHKLVHLVLMKFQNFWESLCLFHENRYLWFVGIPAAELAVAVGEVTRRQEEDRERLQKLPQSRSVVISLFSVAVVSRVKSCKNSARNGTKFVANGCAVTSASSGDKNRRKKPRSGVENRDFFFPVVAGRFSSLFCCHGLMVCARMFLRDDRLSRFSVACVCVRRLLTTSLVGVWQLLALLRSSRSFE